MMNRENMKCTSDKCGHHVSDHHNSTEVWSTQIVDVNIAVKDQIKKFATKNNDLKSAIEN